MSSWLLNWNPKVWSWDTYDQDLQTLRKTGNLPFEWRCWTKRPAVGDRFYLMIVGTGDFTRGIVGSGVITGEQHPADGLQFVWVSFKVLRDYRSESVLEQTELKRRFPNQLWSPQSSGISVRDEYEQPLADLWDEFTHAPAGSTTAVSSGQLQRIAYHARRVPVQQTSTSTVYIRNPYVAAYTKERAHGICQLCGNPAPFNDADGVPYLECHHVKWLMQGGEDHPDNTVALCPNCHRKMHVVNDPIDLAKLKQQLTR